MIEFEPTEFIKESKPWNDLGNIRKVVFKKGVFRGITIYTREQCQFHDNTEWRVKLLEYSFDKVNWTDDWISIRREVKRRNL